MLKKIAILLFCAMPMLVMSQDRFGHINWEELIMSMPELSDVQRAMDAHQAEWESVMLAMNEEFFSKFREFQERQATMPESIRELRQSELADLEQRIHTTRQTAQADLIQKQESLFIPVFERARRAVEEVGAEHGFTYIFNSANSAQSIIFMSPTANDVMPLVRARLGIR